jgi:hypothetical protein
MSPHSSLLSYTPQPISSILVEAHGVEVGSKRVTGNEEMDFVTRKRIEMKMKKRVDWIWVFELELGPTFGSVIRVFDLAFEVRFVTKPVLLPTQTT